MNTASAFRFQLSRRILAIVAVGVPASVVSVAGCSGGGPFGTGNCGSETSPQHEECFAWPQPTATTAAATTGAGGAGGAGGGGGGMAGAGGSGAGGGDPVTCPSQDDAKTIFENANFNTTTLKSNGTLKSGNCCYQVVTEQICIGGRPFLVEEAPRTAAVRRGSGVAWGSAGAVAPRVADLSPGERAELAEAWTRDGLFEHASVASFGRFALELLAAGAPADLLDGAHRAALDEVRHARLCLSLASAYAGEPVEPARFPFDDRVEVTSDLAVLAARAAREGCVGETIAAVHAAEQLSRATDPAVRAALAIIAEDEARHAELAWRTVRWAIGEGGAPVRDAVAAVFASLGSAEAREEAASDDRLEAHGRLGSSATRAAAARALEEVVKPCGRALSRWGRERPQTPGSCGAPLATG
jgi:hypothetical protein